jgi:hypothetical protein
MIGRVMPRLITAKTPIRTAVTTKIRSGVQPCSVPNHEIPAAPTKAANTVTMTERFTRGLFLFRQ